MFGRKLGQKNARRLDHVLNYGMPAVTIAASFAAVRWLGVTFAWLCAALVSMSLVMRLVSVAMIKFVEKVMVPAMTGHPDPEAREKIRESLGKLKLHRLLPYRSRTEDTAIMLWWMAAFAIADRTLQIPVHAFAVVTVAETMISHTMPRVAEHVSTLNREVQ